ncbi:biopolymer transporter ExbD [Gilvimarinus sp. SDUM040013]|uniref:Biopolymer transporter ExbD n=1 Tax=Gilvimarinus gilvus TaxID=3058038 RepID=A0ABU4RUG2_9GAMM|nr:biopolymer transporter ExbD [Gilvimarinus sp. SDUM040013]MDO3388611.1 biopolymer transporter ExbD [Gilvimarinus sp. SDUM040013]MDX6848517.1 biopolymer transporter ExbD [Gilvimarinus sp. SDUM040013]
MQRDFRQRLESEEQTDIDLAPLLDVVFILLIFFIVTSVFIRESGVDIDKPSAATAQEKTDSIIIIAITDNNEVVYGGQNIGLNGVRKTVTTELRRSDKPVVIQSDKSVSTDMLVKVIDQIKLGGATDVSISTEL